MNSTTRDLIHATALAERVGADQAQNSAWYPAFHLAPPVGWLNDPNGLCQWKGVYHFFFQYAPLNVMGGLKMWGHYTSTDLISWKYEGPALLPDEQRDCHGVYSGSACNDENGMWMYYTGNVKQMGKDLDYIVKGREHNVIRVFSADGIHFDGKELLMTNADYPENVTCHVRDPKVWKQDGTWYMVLGARTVDDVGEVLVYTSDDGAHWQLKNTLNSDEKFGFMWECPDLFTVDGCTFLSVSPQGVEAQGMEFQNIYQSGVFPLEGDFRGDYHLGRFTELDRGFDFYAPQTFVDEQGRRILVGWFGLPDLDGLYENPTTEDGWMHCLTIPRVLSCKNGHLLQNPVPELQQLRVEETSLTVQGNAQVEQGKVFEALIQIEQTGGPVEVEIRQGAVLTWKDGVFTLSFRDGGYGRTTRSCALSCLEQLHIFCDTSSIEVFINGGQEVFSSRFYPTPEQQGLRLHGDDLQASLQLWPLRPMEMA